MFHVKHQSEQVEVESTSWEELWEKDSAPYDAKIWKEIKAPWELLDKQRFTQLLEASWSNGGRSQLPLGSGQGELLTEDRLFYEGEWVTGNIRVEGSSGCTKAKMRCFSGDRELKGASYVQAGVYLSSEQGSPIAVGAGCFIQTGSSLTGPVSLGRNCEVRQGAFLRGMVLAGDRAVLGHSSEFKGVILHSDAKAAHFAYVGDSILGSAVNLGAGTKISNLKITGSEIRIPFESSRIATKMRKLGAIMGDSVETGCNSVLNPGVILGKSSGVYPAIAVQCGVYAAKSWVIDANKTEKRK